MRGEDHHALLRHLLFGVDEHGSAAPQLVHHVGVVHDLTAHVDRPVAREVERPLDGGDGAVDPGAVPARSGEQETSDGHAPRVVALLPPP